MGSSGGRIQVQCFSGSNFYFLCRVGEHGALGFLVLWLSVCMGAISGGTVCAVVDAGVYTGRRFRHCFTRVFDWGVFTREVASSLPRRLGYTVVWVSSRVLCYWDFQDLRMLPRGYNRQWFCFVGKTTDVGGVRGGLSIILTMVVILYVFATLPFSTDTTRADRRADTNGGVGIASGIASPISCSCGTRARRIIIACLLGTSRVVIGTRDDLACSDGILGLTSAGAERGIFPMFREDVI